MPFFRRRSEFWLFEYNLKFSLVFSIFYLRKYSVIGQTYVIEKYPALIDNISDWQVSGSRVTRIAKPCRGTG